jgi:tRNA(Ile)-lysidine synthase
MNSVPDHKLIQHLQATLATVKAKRLWVGLSGGLDSTVLLHAVAQLNLPQPLHACHIHHGLSDYADEWQQHCQVLCEELQVPLITRQVDVELDGSGLEDAARKARYAVFVDVLEAGDVLLLAHHLDDQAETLLLRLMRGAGPKGLGAMDEQRSIGAAQLLRPLLSRPRAELEVYAQLHQLSWIDDDSNSDESLDRNYLRHQVMPLLEDRWPGFSQRWSQSARLCRSQDQLGEALALDDLEQLDGRRDRAGVSLSLPALQALPLTRRQLLLRAWCDQQGVAMPSLAQLQQVEQQLIDHRQDSEAEVQWDNVSLRCFRQRLYLYRTPSPIEPLSVDWDLAQPLPLSGGATLSATAAGRGLSPGHTYHVRWRQGGERCKPYQRKHSQTLKKLLQEYEVAPWLRDRVPLIYVGDEIAAVGDLWICSDFAVDEVGYILNWHAGFEL